jgi:hypothetical protein
MSLRSEFVAPARTPGANVRQLGRRFAIRPKAAYEWLARAAGGDDPLADRSRRPTRSLPGPPARSPAGSSTSAAGTRPGGVRGVGSRTGYRPSGLRITVIGYDWGNDQEPMARQ